MFCPQFALNLEVELDNDPGKFGGSTTNRKCTDIFALIIVVLFFGVVMGLTIYCILNSDIDKLRNGYDDSGNICGKNNIKPDSMQFEGFGENMENKKYVLIKQDGALGKTKECVENCTMRNFTLVSNFCVSDERIIPLSFQLLDTWLFILLAWITGVVLSLFMLIVYYKFTRDLHTLYFLIITFAFGVNAVGYWWIYRDLQTWLDAKIGCLSSIIMLIILILNSKFYFQARFRSSIYAAQIIVETAVTNISMHLLWLQPLFSSIIFSSVLVLVICCWFLLQTISHLEQIGVGPLNETIVEYVPYPIATVTGALLIYGFILFYEILKNWQCMVVGGCAAQWYFTRRSGGVSRPIRRTVGNLLKYHLGTLCLGSIILPPIYVVRSVVNAIKGVASGRNKESVYTCPCRLLSEIFFATFTTPLDSFSRNGFVLTAIYGCTFCKGTIRAHKLISHNKFNAAALTRYADYIFVWKKFALLFILSTIFFFYTVFTSTHLKYDLIICTMIVLFCYLVIDIFVSVIEVTVDTFMLCFCEDVLYRSGVSKPYYMSTNFAQFVENASKELNPVKWRDVADYWETGPKRLYSHENFAETQVNLLLNANLC